jgi:hypothetical protein
LSPNSESTGVQELQVLHQALKDGKVRFLDEVVLPSFMQKKGKKGSKSGSSESSTKTAPKKKGTLKIRIPVKKPIPEPIPEPTPPSSPKPSDSETESDEGPVYREAYANINNEASIKDLDEIDMSFDDWDKNIDEFVEECAQRPLTEADAKLEEERLQKEKMKEPMTAEQEETHSNLGLSVEEENERVLKLGILHSKIDSFQANLPPPPQFTQTTEVGGSSSAPEAGGSSTIPESATVTGTGAAIIVYETPNVSPTDVEMHTASEQGEEEEADHMDTEVPHLLTLEEMEIQERAQKEELKRKQEEEEARLEALEQARLDERIRMGESRKAEEAAKLAEENRLQEVLMQQKAEEEAKLAEATRLHEEAEAKLAEEQRLKAEAG